MTIAEHRFQHHTLRAIERDGVRWWVVSDVSSAVGFSKARVISRSIAEHDLDMYVTGGSGQRRHLIASESSLIRALSKSRTPSADVFLRWLVTDVPRVQPAAQVSVEPREIQIQPATRAMSPSHADAPAWLEQVMGTIAQGMAVLSGTTAQNRAAVEGLACEVAETRNWVEAVEDEGRREAAAQRAEIERLSNTVASLADKERTQAIRHEIDRIKGEITATLRSRGATEKQANSAFWINVKAAAGVASVAPENLTPSLALRILDAARNEARLRGVNIKQPNPVALGLWAVNQ
jgi:prophage antirepressor-like protein